MKPNYMIIGAAKCATSTLTQQLGDHPEVFMVECKEPFFFSHDEIYARGFDWYESLYDAAGSKPMRGEGSNLYTEKEAFPEASRRIHAYIPEGLKLIYIIRHPLRRIESWWMQLRANGGEVVHYDFDTALRKNRDRLIDSTNYWQQVRVYMDLYGAENVLILFFEDFKADQQGVLRRCFEHLGVDPDFRVADEKRHVGLSARMRVQGATLSRLRQLPHYNRIVRLIPQNIRAGLRKPLFYEPSVRPTWTKEGQRLVLDILAEDTRQILDYCGKPPGFWDLESPSQVTRKG